MRTKKNIHVSSSDDEEVNLTVPESWEELNDRQLRNVLRLIAKMKTTEAARLFVFASLSGIKRIDVQERYVYFNHEGKRCRVKIKAFIASVVSGTEWMEKQPELPFRPFDIHGASPVEARMHGVPFGVYLQAENHWQQTLNASEDEQAEHIDAMTTLLVPGISQKDSESRLAVTLWWCGLKNYLSGMFRDLFRPSGSGGEAADLHEMMLTQIRALTGGDVTKEEAVLNVDTWTALAELNAKAREAREIEKLKSK